MNEQLPVTVAVRRADGSVEQVRIGVATRTADGFSLSLGELSIGSSPIKVEAHRPRSSGSAPGGFGGGGAGGEVTTLPNYGRSKGAPIFGATMQDLEYYANGARRSLDDPSKARFHDKERALLVAIEAEIARQRGGDSGGYADDVPPPTDDDAPF